METDGDYFLRGLTAEMTSALLVLFRLEVCLTVNNTN